MSLSSISFIKKLSLILSRKAYLIYTDNPIPSLLIPLSSTDSSIKKAIYKTFSELTNDEILTFHSKAIAQKDLNNIERQHKARLNIDDVNFTRPLNLETIENIEITPESLFLTVNQIDHSLAFMSYDQLKKENIKAQTNPGETVYKGEKRQQEEIKKQKEQDKYQKGVKGPQGKTPEGKTQGKQPQTKKKDSNGKQEEFVGEKQFQHQEISTWNEQSPQLGTKPEDQPKEDQQNVHINKFIPLAYLTDHIAAKPIQIIHIQTSRQYLFFQFLKVFLVMNALVLYGLVRKATRPQHHDQIRGKQ